MLPFLSMRHLLFGFALVFLFFMGKNLCAQSIVFQDNFRSQSTFWEMEPQPDQGVAWEAGDLRLEQAGTQPLLLLGEQYLSFKEDWEISATFAFQPGPSKGTFGLIWSADEDKEQWFAYEVREDGYYRAIKRGINDSTILIDWTRHRKLKKIAEGIHYVKVAKVKWGIYLWFDEKELVRIPFEPFLGQHRGMILKGRSKVTVSSFRIQHPRIQITRARGGWPNVVRLQLDSSINDPLLDDIAPQYDLEHDRFYFSRGPVGQARALDIWQTQLTDTGWSFPVVSPLSSQAEDVVAFIHPRGKSLWATSRYSSYRDKNLPGLVEWSPAPNHSWQEPETQPVPHPKAQRRQNSWYLSPRQDILLFSAELPGGFGDQDIYVSVKERGGSWSTPQNLGPGVNGYGRECCPYYDAAKGLLYFSSNSYPGYGRGDIYVARRISKTWTRWESLKNLGPQINGPAWEAWFYKDPKFERTYYYASQDTIGSDFDLYKVRVPRDLTEEPVVRVYGNLIHQKTKESLRGTAEAHLLNDAAIRRKGFSGQDSTTYSMIVPYGQLYRLQGIVPGYLPLADTLDLRLTTRFQEIKRDLYLTPLEVGATIRLERIYFERGTPELLSDSYPELNHLAVLMRSLPSLEIEIQGHTDNIGNAAFLQRLSEARANRVRNYLVKQGISADRMQAKGFGSSIPIASNENPQTRPLNRRVEFLVIKR